jgi:hypothetical protein
MSEITEGAAVAFIDGDAVVVRVSFDTIKTAAASHPEYWDGESDPSVPCIAVTDAEVFARELVREINREDPDNGSTPLTRLLDASISRIVNDGCEGFDIEALDANMQRRNAL